MAKIRYIREDLPRTKNTMHIRGHPLNPIEEIIVTRLNEIIQAVNDDKKLPSNAPTERKKTTVVKNLLFVSTTTLRHAQTIFAKSW